MKINRKGSAVWRGGLKDGRGKVSTESGVLTDTPVSFGSRFENGAGSNPEELIAAAHAACFSMALSSRLGEAGKTAENIRTTAVVSVEKLEAGWTITESRLEVIANIPDMDWAAFEKAANEAKSGCPVSRLLNAKITLEAALET